MVSLLKSTLLSQFHVVRGSMHRNSQVKGNGHAALYSIPRQRKQIL